MDNFDVKNAVILTKPVYRKPSKGVAGGKGFTVGRVLLEKVRPFRFAMLVSLQRKGISVAHLRFRHIAALFYNNFCTNAFGVAPVDVSSFGNNVAFKIRSLDEAAPYNSNGRVSSQVNEVAEVTEYIIEQFKQSNEKYKVAKMYGQRPDLVLTDEELLQASAFRKVYSNLRKEVQGDNFVKVATIKQVLKIAVISFVIYYILKSI